VCGVLPIRIGGSDEANPGSAGIRDAERTLIALSRASQPTPTPSSRWRYSPARSLAWLPVAHSNGGLSAREAVSHREHISPSVLSDVESDHPRPRGRRDGTSKSSDGQPWSLIRPASKLMFKRSSAPCLTTDQSTLTQDLSWGQSPTVRGWANPHASKCPPGSRPTRRQVLGEERACVETLRQGSPPRPNVSGHVGLRRLRHPSDR
jgi:hypothetical protein